MNTWKVKSMRSNGETLDDVCIDCGECLAHPCVECEDCPVGRLKIKYKKEITKVEKRGEVEGAKKLRHILRYEKFKKKDLNQLMNSFISEMSKELECEGEGK